MPNLAAGQSFTARATLSNPTEAGFNYTAELYLGVPKAASSGMVSFSLAPGESKDILFLLTMPSMEATFPVYLDVFVGGVLIAAYEATEMVTTVISPEVVVGPIIWE